MLAHSSGTSLGAFRGWPNAQWRTGFDSLSQTAWTRRVKQICKSFGPVGILGDSLCQTKEDLKLAARHVIFDACNSDAYGGRTACRVKLVDLAAQTGVEEASEGGIIEPLRNFSSSDKES